MRLQTIVFTTVFFLSTAAIAAEGYLCKPSYAYSGWMPARTITLNSTYYQGYGPTVEEAQAQAQFLCQLVYRHCTTDATHCKKTAARVIHCLAGHQQASGYHHDRNAAAWIAKNRCQQGDAWSTASTCRVTQCGKMKKPVPQEAADQHHAIHFY